ncbi:hypothetical protein HY498_05300 [Candidatus Woesearchaeota archaeon]|nr:hypothetical protein [Candidatus Woesearchaeota archaeon]
MHKLKTLEQLTLNKDNQFINSKGQFVKVEPIGLPHLISIQIYPDQNQSRLFMEALMDDLSNSRWSKKEINSYTKGVPSCETLPSVLSSRGMEAHLYPVQYYKAEVPCYG